MADTPYTDPELETNISLDRERAARNQQLVALITERDEQLAAVKALQAENAALRAELDAVKPPPKPEPEPPKPEPDLLAAIRWPAKGHIFMGHTATAGVRQHHEIVGRRGTFHHVYTRGASRFAEAFDNTPIGCVPFINSKPAAGLVVTYEGRTVTLGGMGRASYQATVDGKVDSALDVIASAIKAYGKPCAVAFMHEPENDTTGMAAADIRLADMEFAAAFRYIVDYMRRAGVKNALWVQNFMGFTNHFSRIPTLDAGPKHVDVYAIDPYCHDASEDLLTFGVMKGAALQHYDYFAQYGKPIWWAEWGIDKPTAATAAARMLTADGVARLQERCPLLVGLHYWNEWLKPQTDPKTDYRLSNIEPVWRRFAQLPVFDNPLPAGVAR